MFYKSVNLFYEPEMVCNQITENQSEKYSEMTSFEKAFLCGLLKEKRPKKIVELGVSGGGTTAVILTCLKLLQSTGGEEIYSVDLEEKWYRNSKKETGFLAKEYMGQLIGLTDHKFLLGKPIPYVMNEIGQGIDFLILDTTHVMPGELLDFLICFPYLNAGCLVVLHDVLENYFSCDSNRISTKLLFDLIHGEKWYMNDKSSDAFGLSNIAAFEVSKKTMESIAPVFSALTFSWTYMFEKKDTEKYIESIKENYGEQYEKYMEKIFMMQRSTQIKMCINNHYRLSYDFLEFKWRKQKNVFLYGTGYWAKIYYEFAQINSLPICGYVVSDDQDIEVNKENGMNIYKLNELDYKPEECSFVLALDHKYFTQVKRNLENKGYYIIL